MGSDDDIDWHWQPGDQGFNFEIPTRERLPLPPSTVLQGRYGDWISEVEAGWVPDLRGCTLDEVEREAARIKLGDVFTSLKQFDRCLHNWCVLNGRVAGKAKMQYNYGLRTCRYGPRTRAP